MSYVAEQLCLLWKNNMAVREHSSEAIPRQSTGHRIKHGNDNHDLKLGLRFTNGIIQRKM